MARSDLSVTLVSERFLSVILIDAGVDETPPVGSAPMRSASMKPVQWRMTRSWRSEMLSGISNRAMRGISGYGSRVELSHTSFPRRAAQPSPPLVVWQLMLRPLYFLTVATLLSASAVPAADAVVVAGSGPLRGDGPARLPRVAPESAGMSMSRLVMIDDVVRQGIRAGGFPGAAVIVARRGAVVWERGYGTLDWRSGVAVDAERTMYDLASLTKVVATTAAAMVLVEQEKLRLDEHVTHYLPAFSGGAKDQITIRDLLTHRSGLPAGRDISRRGAGPESARKVVLATSLVRAPGSDYEYSDLGLDVMGFVIEQITHETLDQFVRRAVYTPLGMRSTMFRPTPSLRARIAPTGKTIARGDVHDGTARALGGVAGHAGLFSTATDLAVFAQVMLDGGVAGSTRFFADSVVRAFTKPGPGWRALGWQTCPGDGSCGQYLSTRAFGHTGFTGTSMWIDPERDLVVIVLTNWIHGRASGGVAPMAIVQHVRSDIVDLAALSITDGGPERPLPWRLRTQLQLGWNSNERP
jgi:CubicO group peptidase (beta-lactamase class C family)